MSKADKQFYLIQMKINISLIFISTVIYSILRYNVFGEVPIADIPTFILNKAVSFSMIIILLFVFFTDKKSKNYYDYTSGFKLFAIIHILISISLLSQNYYPKLYEGSKFTLLGNISILTGIVLTALMLSKKIQMKNVLIYVMASIHVFFIGIKGWFNVEKWNGKMPPITLICFLILVILVILSIKNKRNDNL